MSTDELLEVKPEWMVPHKGDWPGAFPLNVADRIAKLVQAPTLHLFSGSSKIGDVRVDFNHPNATVHMDVYDFIEQDNRDWSFVVADPVYKLKRDHNEKKLRRYGKYDPVAGNVLSERLISTFLQQHAQNVLWFDTGSPCPWGFERHKVWLYIPGHFFSCRVLTWLKRKGERLQ